MILEMRTYVLKPGATHNFVERFAEGLTARLQFSKLLGLWTSEVGGLNRVVHVWPYESFEDRERRSTKDRQVAAQNSRIYRHAGKQDHSASALFTAIA
jgi:hypothetical protein